MIIDQHMIFRYLTSEVNFGLKGKQSQSQAKSCSDTNGHQDPFSIMVNRDTRDHNRQGQSKYAQSNDISRRFSPNTGTAGNSNVGDKKDNIRNNVHDKSILTRPDTFFWEWIIEFWFSKLIAIKISNTWCKYNDQNKSKSD